MRKSVVWHAAAVCLLGTMLSGHMASAQDKTVLTVWSHEIGSEPKVAWRELAAANFEKAHPGVDVKITWYDKPDLNAALKAALLAGTGPDAFYIEPDQTEYIENGFIIPLDDMIDWSVIHPWTREVWRHDGKTYGVPQEVYTVDLEYNSALMDKLGIKVPDSKQFTGAEFLDVVRKSAAAGITPMAVGVGNRPYPGAFFTHELLLKQLGLDDYGKLLKGGISYKDPRVMKVFDYVKEVADAKGFPTSFTTLKLGETFPYFAVKPGALMAPMGSFMVPNIANPPEKGGPPPGFPMSFMKFPVLDGAACPECKTAAVGASFAINANSPHKELAAAFLQEMAKPEMGVLWLQNILLQTATLTGDAKVSGPYAKYFEELLAVNNDAKVFVGLANDNLTGQCKDTFAQVVNTALPAGLISPADAAARLDQDCYTG